MRATLRGAPALLLCLVAFLAGCKDDPTAPATGELRVTATTGGVDPDGSGYTLVIDGDVAGPVPANGVATFADVRTGIHEIQLGAMNVNCAAAQNPRSIEVTEAATTDVEFAVNCVAMVGAIRVTVTTEGPEIDADGYSVVVNETQTATVQSNGDVVIPGIRAEAASVSLSGLADNCDVEAPHPRTTQVSFAQTAHVEFFVWCHGTASLRVTAASSGIDLPGEYGVQVAPVAEGGFSYVGAVPASGEALIEEVGAGEYDVSLSGISPNCAVAGTTRRRVLLASGETADAAFDVACVEAPLLMFAMSEGGQSDIAVVKANGAAFALVLGGPAADSDPDWAPGGARVAFRSDRDGNAEIYAMDADGTDVVRLTTHAELDLHPAWSPDGSRIAFVSHRHGNSEIYVMLADGSGLTRLTNSSATDSDPAWSPDGTRILFSSDRDGDAEIHVMDADGTDVQALTSHPDWDGAPAWSPDGSSIAFIRCSLYYYTCYDSRLVVMDPDGTDEASLYQSEILSGTAWSADGGWIAVAEECYYYCYDATPGIVAVSRDGARSFVVRQGSATSPSWRR